MPRRSTFTLLVLLAATLSLPPTVAMAAGPIISGFSPTVGPVGTVVTINGTNLSTVTTATFNGVQAAIQSKSATRLKVVVPATSTGKIHVSSPEGSATSSANYTVTFGIALSVDHVPPTGSVTVSGTGFSRGKSVQLFFDGSSEAFSVASTRGAFAGTAVRIPASAAPGPHWISALDRATAKLAQKSVTVSTNWPMFRGGPAHHGRNDLETTVGPGNVGNLELRWKSVASAGAFQTSPAVVDGMVFVASADQKLYAFPTSCSTPCAPKWTSVATGGPINSSPAVSNGLVWIGTDNDDLWGFPTSCKSPCAPRFSLLFAAPVNSAPTISKGVLYVGSDDKRLHAISLTCTNTCPQLWQSDPTGDVIVSSPAVADDMVFVGSNDGSLYAYPTACSNPCSPAWTSAVSGLGFTLPSPTVANGMVYVGTHDHILYAFPECGGGCPGVWQSQGFGPISSSPGVANGIVYFGAHDGGVYGLPADCSTPCAPVWGTTTSVPGIVTSSPAIANGVLYIGATNGRVYAFRTDCGNPCAPLWVSPPTGAAIYSSPAISDGVLYVGSQDGHVYAYGLPDGGVSAPARPTLKALLKSARNSGIEGNR